MVVFFIILLGALMAGGGWYYFHHSKAEKTPTSDETIPEKKGALYLFPSQLPETDLYSAFELSRNMLKIYRKHLKKSGFGYLVQQTPYLLRSLVKVEGLISDKNLVPLTQQEQAMYQKGLEIFRQKRQLLQLLFSQFSNTTAEANDQQQASILMLNEINKTLILWQKILEDPEKYL